MDIKKIRCSREKSIRPTGMMLSERFFHSATDFFLFSSEYIKISGDEYYENDDWGNKAQIEFNYLVFRELNSVSGIGFGSKAFPTPALLNCTEEEEEHRTNWQQVLAYNKVFKSVD